MLPLFSMTACTQHDNKKLKGFIYERKQVQQNKLMLKYRYKLNEKEYRNSITIANQGINSDSVDLKMDNSTDGKAIPIINK